MGWYELVCREVVNEKARRKEVERVTKEMEEEAEREGVERQWIVFSRRPY